MRAPIREEARSSGIPLNSDTLDGAAAEWGKRGAEGEAIGGRRCAGLAA
jgi:hypothetical protein